MTTLVQSFRESKPWPWIVIGAGILSIWALVAETTIRSRPVELTQALPSREFADSTVVTHERYMAQESSAESAVSQDAAKVAVAPVIAGPERKIIRTSSLDMVVQHPAEVAEKIAALAESLGGYIETSNGGGQNAASGTLTVRVPANQFQKALAEIGKLGLRVENERLDAQDVTRQFVDQDARIRNLRAEEAGFLLILKQATTVKDMLAVSERLSDVRGEIERQHAEFNALSKQIETVSIAISLRTETEAQVFGLNWRPGYQLKKALHDGWESVATYATTMTTILFYLPATLLWAGTIFIGVIAGRRIVLRGKRWFIPRSVPEAKA
jgi:hypothetical protein